jgi:hypothetical protein
MSDSAANLAEIFQPLVDMFSGHQLQMILLAWLPTQIGDYIKTDIYVVDMFILTALSTALVSVLTVIYKYSQFIIDWLKRRESKIPISVQVNYYRIGYWGEEITNPHYTAVSWMISRAARNLNSGQFVMMPVPDYECEGVMLDFSLLPSRHSNCTIEYEGHKYHISFDNSNGNSGDGDNNNNNRKGTPPSIIITMDAEEAHDVDWATNLLRDIYKAYSDYELSKKERGRWELDSDGNWFYVLKQHSARGLDSVALTEENEKRLRHDLETFLGDREFYSRIGLPYRRGYLFHGKPGTGKTSLINAISAQFNRDIYYLNLRNIKSDSMLQSAFSRVPANQVIVFEDIDAMSRVCHRRDRNPLKELSSIVDESKPTKDSASDDGEKAGVMGPSLMGLSSMGPFTLSCLLNCLDGHILNEGVIIIMTSNHPEKLDPALIRAGRIDLQLELGYTTRYQVQRMYDLVVTADDDKQPPLDQEWLASFPEGIVPPCECMRVMVLYRKTPHLIPHELDLLVEKYRKGEIDPELLAKEEEGYVGSDAADDTSSTKNDGSHSENGDDKAKDDTEKDAQPSTSDASASTETTTETQNESASTAVVEKVEVAVQTGESETVADNAPSTHAEDKTSLAAPEAVESTS